STIRGWKPSTASSNSSSRLMTMPSIAWLRNARNTSLADGYSTSSTWRGSKRPSSRARYSGSLPIQTLVPMRNAGSDSRMHPRSGSTSSRQERTCSHRRPYDSRLRAISASVRHEEVALVAHRADEPRMLGIGLDLLAQPHDAQIDAAVERIPVALPVE